MLLNIVTLTGKRIYVNIDNGKNIRHLKEEIEKSEGIFFAHQSLIFAQRKLSNDEVISEIPGLVDGSDIHLVIEAPKSIEVVLVNETGQQLDLSVEPFYKMGNSQPASFKTNLKLTPEEASSVFSADKLTGNAQTGDAGSLQETSLSLRLVVRNATATGSVAPAVNNANDYEARVPPPHFPHHWPPPHHHPDWHPPPHHHHPPPHCHGRPHRRHGGRHPHHHPPH